MLCVECPSCGLNSFTCSQILEALVSHILYIFVLQMSFVSFVTINFMQLFKAYSVFYFEILKSLLPPPKINTTIYTQCRWVSNCTYNHKAEAM